jgi:hypothetical protein
MATDHIPQDHNLTNIQFTPEEQKLLDLGLQYSLHLDKPGHRDGARHKTLRW